jgi:hypothetical protein
MKLQRAVFVLMGMMLLFAGTSSAEPVKADYDCNADFGQYTTYSWEHVKTQDPVEPLAPESCCLAKSNYLNSGEQEV